jgi:subtilisin family serine protease
VDDDHNGYIDDCHGIDTINGDSDPMDDNNHGSHTGGTIGAVGNNGTGVTGFNWKVTVLPCKSHDSAGNGSIDSIITCYQYMVREKKAGWDIISTNNSYGGCPEACGFDRATMDGIAGMGRAGILFAVAAANNASNNDTTPVYPSNYFLPNVLPVAATDSGDAMASFSDYGVRTVMVGAPGVSVLSTIRNNGYAYFSGTSMATPHVAGLAALIHAADPTLTIYQIRNLIIAGGDDIAALAGKTVSGKRIDAEGSLACSNSPVFGLLRPLEDVSTNRQTVAALNINCANGAGPLGVTIKPGNLTLTVKDNGKNADLKKGDGIYSAFWKPAGTGTYTLKFSNGTSYTVTVS